MRAGLGRVGKHGCKDKYKYKQSVGACVGYDYSRRSIAL